MYDHNRAYKMPPCGFPLSTDLKYRYFELILTCWHLNLRKPSIHLTNSCDMRYVFSLLITI